ncbi:MAG: ankyrin repeat domain-containing protein, partial [Myxococcota bacterium]
MSAPGPSLTATLAILRSGTDAEIYARLCSVPHHALVKESDGTMLIHVASHRGRARAVRLLVDAGADVNATTRHQQTPLMWALRPPLIRNPPRVRRIAGGRFVRGWGRRSEPVTAEQRRDTVEVLLAAGA